jgi:hypothetical protein
VCGEACARLAAEGEADGTVGVGQTVGGAGVGLEQPGEPFAEDALRASGIDTAEASDEDAKGDGPVGEWEVGHDAVVVAVDAI